MMSPEVQHMTIHIHMQIRCPPLESRHILSLDKFDISLHSFLCPFSGSIHAYMVSIENETGRINFLIQNVDIIKIDDDDTTMMMMTTTLKSNKNKKK